MHTNEATSPQGTAYPQESSRTQFSGRSRVQAILDRTESTLGWEGNARPLHKRLKEQLRDSPGLCMGGSEDAVLSVAIAAIEGRTVSLQLYNDALFRLERSLEDYETVLAESVPCSLKSEVLERRQARAYHEGTNATVLDDWPQFLRELQDRREVGFFPTGIASLDEALGGGIHGLTMLLANKGVGKTSLLINTIHTSLSSDNSTASLFYFLDSQKARVIERLLCKVNGVDIKDLKASPGIERSPESQGVVHEVFPRLRIKERDFCRKDLGHDGNGFEILGLTKRQIVEDVYALRQVCGARRVLIAIDLFQKMPVPSGQGQSDRDAFRLDAIQEASQHLSKTLGDGNFAFFISSEIRKEAGSAPTMDDMKGDGRLASDADNVLVMWPRRDCVKSQDVLGLALKIDKGRDGVDRCEMAIDFDHRLYRFDDASKQRSDASRSQSPHHRSTVGVDALAE